MRFLFVILGVSLFSYSCQTGLTSSLSSYEAFDTTFLDTLVVLSSKTTHQDINLKYQESAPKTVDLIHNQLSLSFNWEAKMVIGQASLLLKPYYYPLESFEIDAINFSLDSVALMSNHSPVSFQYSYNGKQLKFDPDMVVHPNDTLEVIIHYRVVPASDENHQSNGDDKGLYFIMEDSLTNRRKEIWTLGETQWSAKWFPTINQPNEKVTQSISLTIDTALTSISNGILINSQNNNDGTKTDYWELSLPQSPYLTSITIGQFDYQKDTSGPVDLEYFVQPGFKSDISSIFGQVPAMIDFFSDTFHYRFPWPNYKQIIVQDFVSGAMENTTAVIYGDFIQGHRNEISGLGNDAIVAHELVHHWFGNLVTCENWANITLNEGFANYGEALWISNYHGKEAGEYHRFINAQEYFQDAYLAGPLPLVSYYYSDPEKLFNTHTYNKGGAVLHMLRTYLGDRGFFDGVSYYLKENEYSNTEIDHLRLAFEEVSGLDLQQFFTQWFYQPGHPRISYESKYDSSTSTFNLVISQEHAFKQEFQHLFSFPIKIGYVLQEDFLEYEFFMSNEKEQISFSLPVAPEFVIIDPGLDLLAEYSVNFSLSQWEKLLSLPVNSGWKIKSFEEIMSIGDDNTREKAVIWGLKNPSPIFQELALQAIEDYQLESFADTLIKIGTIDQRPENRALAWRVHRRLSKIEDSKLLLNTLSQEKNPKVLAELIKTLTAEPLKLGEIELITSFENRVESLIIEALGKFYSQRKMLDKLSFFERHLYTIKDDYTINFFESYLSLFPESGLLKIFQIALDSRNSRLRKYAATYAIYHLAKVWKNIDLSVRTEANVLIDKILSKERDQTLIDLYFAFK